MANNQSVRRHLNALPEESNHWEAGGRPQCDKVWLQSSGTAHSIVSPRLFGDNFKLQEQLSGGFSSGFRPRGSTPADDTRSLCLTEALWGLQFLHVQQCTMSSLAVAAEQLLEIEDGERMDCGVARSPDLNPIEHVWRFVGRRLARPYLTTSNDSGASIGAARRMGSNAPPTTH
ncbi:hypothetical protein TNCV_2282551 [Trichonephila clavipes]|nr:hypothetical protein TNCV_2282551 [Trichonephila clavipes]